MTDTKKEILKEINLLIKKNPELRFTQIINLIMDERISALDFYRTDFTLLKKLQKLKGEK